MKKLVVALAALAFSAPVLAQQGGSNGGQFGLGVAITPLTPYTSANARVQSPISPAVEVYVPLRIAPNLRVEPSIGIFSVDNPGAASDSRDLTLGVGVFALQKASSALDIYAGGRLKLNFASLDPGDSGTDFIIAAAAGGEYYLAPKLSLGVEAQLGFFSNSDVSGDTSGFYTNGLGFIRVYF